MGSLTTILLNLHCETHKIWPLDVSVNVEILFILGTRERFPIKQFVPLIV